MKVKALKRSGLLGLARKSMLSVVEMFGHTTDGANMCTLVVLSARAHHILSPAAV